jgi:hypothetical protein
MGVTFPVQINCRNFDKTDSLPATAQEGDRVAAEKIVNVA